MTTNQDSPDASAPGGDPAPNPKRRRWLRYTVFGALGAIAAALGLGAVAHGKHGGGWHGGMRYHAEHRLEHLLDDLDATPVQREKIKAIAETAFESMGSLRESKREDRRALLETLTAPEIDRDTLEGLRAKQIARFDDASRDLARAIADAVDVLDPDQRARLAKHLRRFGRHR